MYFLGRSNQFLTDLLEETEILKMTSKQIASKFRRSVQKQIKRQQTLQTRVCWQKYSSQKHLFDTRKFFCFSSSPAAANGHNGTRETQATS